MFKWLNSKKKDNKGFTLVELVIVVAILAILVGLLAPQYTKYVEKSRKAADASNMDEMVKVIKVYAADPVNDLEKGKYTITISDAGTKIKATEVATAVTIDKDSNTGLGKEMKEAIPNWWQTKVKSQKWGVSGAKGSIIAVVEVKSDGGTAVTYGSKTGNTADASDKSKFAKYMETGSEQ